MKKIFQILKPRVKNNVSFKIHFFLINRKREMLYKVKVKKKKKRERGHDFCF